MKKLLVVLFIGLALPCLAFGQAQPPKPGPEVQKLGFPHVLPLALFAAPSQQVQWPRKGDKVFVAATFEGMLKMRVGSRDADLPLVSCQELVVKDAKPDKPRWSVAFLGMGSGFRLEGPWLPRMHKTKQDCTAQVSAEGEPEVKRSGETFTILPANPK